MATPASRGSPSTIGACARALRVHLVLERAADPSGAPSLDPAATTTYRQRRTGLHPGDHPPAGPFHVKPGNRDRVRVTPKRQDVAALHAAKGAAPIDGPARSHRRARVITARQPLAALTATPSESPPAPLPAHPGGPEPAQVGSGYGPTDRPARPDGCDHDTVRPLAWIRATGAEDWGLHRGGRARTGRDHVEMVELGARWLIHARRRSGSSTSGDPAGPHRPVLHSQPTQRAGVAPRRGLGCSSTTDGSLRLTHEATHEPRRLFRGPAVANGRPGTVHPCARDGPAVDVVPTQRNDRVTPRSRPFA